MTKCPNCGWSPEDDFEPTTADGIGDFTSFMDSVIKRISDKQKKEMGYGIPDNPEELTMHDPEDLGSVITGEWRQHDNQKDN